MTHRHTIHRRHYGWTAVSRPWRNVAPGESLEFDVLDASDGQLRPASVVEDIPRLDFSTVNPITGPVFVDGAEPGDILEVTLLSFSPLRMGLDRQHSGLWPLGGRFQGPRASPLALRPRNAGAGIVRPMGEGGLSNPSPGPSEWRPRNRECTASSRPAGSAANMDVRDIAQGTRLYLPVEVGGALFFRGATPTRHRATARCAGTAIESPMRVALRFDLIKQTPLSFPRFHHPGTGPPAISMPRAYEVATGIGPDLMEAARAAVRSMIDLLTRRHGMPAVDAYLLCSVCGDLRISEIVDLPNWTVSFYFPRVVFD